MCLRRLSFPLLLIRSELLLLSLGYICDGLILTNTITEYVEFYMLVHYILFQCKADAEILVEEVTLSY